ncbi:uncharacterized protein K460DRAFT_353082 [Cucurbitaria berberidis CBS 394.84]|uniref:RING-type domain-containing protein n=1 Tax=Cucurbitaria berberidis CBS 394.84 TaxID=1168544 RepID=A0A9P4GMR1_9PLEO|nr:uncharacterized protein K460DRAFT_353082 [Cucurbitaria berberidis CBS 394.84]KAF1848049.1 hypothetical protein K460DRAFT_353082 [Cucurbitaria berberidis CBS 394.84]
MSGYYRSSFGASFGDDDDEEDSNGQRGQWYGYSIYHDHNGRHHESGHGPYSPSSPSRRGGRMSGMSLGTPGMRSMGGNSGERGVPRRTLSYEELNYDSDGSSFSFDDDSGSVHYIDRTNSTARTNRTARTTRANGTPPPALSSDRATTFMEQHTDFLSHGDTTDPPNTECPICLEGIEEHICVRITGIEGCHHMFGLECLQELLKHQPHKKKECPLCRNEWMPEEGIWQDDERLTRRRGHGAVRPTRQPTTSGGGRDTRPRTPPAFVRAPRGPYMGSVRDAQFTRAGREYTGPVHSGMSVFDRFATRRPPPSPLLQRVIRRQPSYDTDEDSETIRSPLRIRRVRRSGHGGSYAHGHGGGYGGFRGY